MTPLLCGGLSGLGGFGLAVGLLYLYIGLARDYSRLDAVADGLRRERDLLAARLAAAEPQDAVDGR